MSEPRDKQGNAPVRQRVLSDPALMAQAEALLAVMTLEQKIGQMTQAERMAVSPEEVRDYHLGSVLGGAGSWPEGNTPEAWVAMNDAYWAASMTSDDAHLGIPLLYGVDAVHGHNNVRGATVFPHNIGLGAAHDPELIARIAKVTAREVLATGVEWTFAPTLAVAQDYRWGRTYESYSSDPDLVAQYADAFVSALQVDLGDDSVIGCAKHWVGDGGTSQGIDQGDTAMSAEQLRRHMAPYIPAIEAGVLAVMASFNSWNGNKCHGHHHLLTEVLRGELGFAGLIISDWDGINYLCEDYGEAAAMGVNAGIDLFMVSETWKAFIACMITNVERGHVAMSRIDDAVRRILMVKLAWGLFERPRPTQRPWSNHSSFGSAEHRAVAREAVRKSLVLLKNTGGLLPLRGDARVLVAGKNADNAGHQCGGFTVDWQGLDGNAGVAGGISIWQGIRQLAPNAQLSTDPLAADADPAHHDVAVVVVGERPYAEGMGDIRASDDVIVAAGSRINGTLKALTAYGAALNLSQLHPEDLACIGAIADKGIPVVTILLSGRPLVVASEMALSGAFVAAWLPGSEGQGVADVIFGEHDFHGRLSFAWPASEPDAGGNYQTLFARGFGLRYSD